jgi:hypothetical protein
MLNLLLNLSESPLQASFKPIISKSKLTPKLKVEDIFREEPLEGSHWEKKLNYEDDDDDDDDWDFDVKAWIRERLGDRAVNLPISRRSVSINFM